MSGFKFDGTTHQGGRESEKDGYCNNTNSSCRFSLLKYSHTECSKLGQKRTRLRGNGKGMGFSHSRLPVPVACRNLNEM